MFGGAVEGPDVWYTRGYNNKQFFHRRNAQMGWAMRLRAQATERLLNGGEVEPGSCLFIDPEIRHVEDFMAELSQPEWEDDTGPMKVDKTPEDAPSPNRYDAAILAFAGDSRYGLKKPK